MKIANRKLFPRPGQRGFTLLELMVVLAIVAILVGIAVPSYSVYVRKAERKAAMAALQGLAQAMERFYAQSNSYKDAADENGVPRHFPATSPLDGPAKYNLRITAADDSSYTLQAQPIDGKGQEQDGMLQLDSTGQRAWDRNADKKFSDTEMTWSDH